MTKRILFVEANTDGTIGGSHYSLLSLIQHLDRGRYDPVAILYEDSPVVPLYRQTCALFILNLKNYLRIPVAWLRKPLNALMHLGIILRCVVFIVSKRIQLVHLSNSVLGGYDTWLVACLLTRVPCITHERGFSVFDLSRRRVTRYLVRKYRCVICVSEAMRQNLLNRGLAPERVITIHNGIDAGEYRGRVYKTTEQVRTALGVAPEIPLIGLVGNIRRWKGQALLVDALRLVLKETSRFACVFVGEVAKGSDDDLNYVRELRGSIARYQMAEQCIFTGYRGDIPDLMNAFDIVVNPSIEPDPFPRVILEAMALGRVVIATDLGGAVESVVEGETGYLVPADDPAVLADRILRLLRDPSLRARMSAAAAARVAMFDIRRTTLQTETVYNTVLAE
jgi:glycosyltransferase involved in cell wall biosynthesis